VVAYGGTPNVSDHDPRPLEVRLEAAFDRFNRAAMLGMEPTPVLFLEALEAEGLRLQLTAPDVSSAEGSESEEHARRADGVASGRAHFQGRAPF
jgi:hypothetical protein